MIRSGLFISGTVLLPRSADIGTRLHRTGLGFNQAVGPNSRVLGPADPDRVAGSAGLRICPRDGPMIFDGDSDTGPWVKNYSDSDYCSQFSSEGANSCTTALPETVACERSAFATYLLRSRRPQPADPAIGSPLMARTKIGKHLSIQAYAEPRAYSQKRNYQI